MVPRLHAVALVGLLVGIAFPGEVRATPLTDAAAAVARADYATAERLAATIATGPDAPAARLVQAEVELRTGRYARAAETGAAAAALGATSQLAAAPLRAEALTALGKRAEAIAVLREVAGQAAGHRARLMLGELLVRTGKRGEAAPILDTLLTAYRDDVITSTDAEGLALVARAAWLLGQPKNANQVFDEAEAAGPARVEELLWRTELARERWADRMVGELTDEAVKLAPADPRVIVAQARAVLESTVDFATADALVRRALAIDPNLAGAHAVAAALALRDLDLTRAAAAVAAGLATDPDAPELLALDGAVRLLRDDRKGFAAVERRLLATDPTAGEFYVVIATYLEWEHRYDDLVKLMTKARTRDPRNPRVLATLGTNLLHTGDEAGALAAFQAAFAADPFNVRAFNFLNLLEQTLPRDYVLVPGKRFRIRYHRDERALLERYLPRLLDEAWTTLSKRYKFKPKGPITIDLYADREAFGILTSGLPNVGIQGSCFGRRIAALAPQAGEYNVGNVLWHELAHVFALQLSKNRVPRWFAEGLAEYDASQARPEWQREEDLAVYRWVQAGRLPSVLDLNQRFTHTDSVDEVVAAYAATGMLVTFIVGEFGFDRAVAMLKRWGAGAATPAVITDALGVAPTELDRRFRARLDQRLARYAGQFVPDPSRPVDAAVAAAVDAARAGDLPRARTLVAQLTRDGHDGYQVRMLEAELAEAAGDRVALKTALLAATSHDPSQVEPVQALYDVATADHDAAAQLAALRAVTRLDQHTRTPWRLLLSRLVADQAWPDAVAAGAAAVLVDPEDLSVHRDYATALEHSGDLAAAAFELESAALALPTDPRDAMLDARLHDELAEIYDRLGKRGLAAKARAAAAAAATAAGP